MFDVRSLFAAFRRRRTRGPQTPYEFGVVALAEGRHADAVRHFEAALAAASGAPERAAASNKRAVALVALGRRDDALAGFADALEAEERFAPALVNVGNLLLEDEHPEDAVDYYEAALRADRNYAPAYFNLGVAFKRLGRRPEAVRCLRAAARLESRRSPRPA